MIFWIFFMWTDICCSSDIFFPFFHFYRNQVSCLNWVYNTFNPSKNLLNRFLWSVSGALWCFSLNISLSDMKFMLFFHQIYIWPLKFGWHIQNQFLAINRSCSCYIIRAPIDKVFRIDKLDSIDVIFAYWTGCFHSHDGPIISWKLKILVQLCRAGIYWSSVVWTSLWLFCCYVLDPLFLCHGW